MNYEVLNIWRDLEVLNLIWWLVQGEDYEEDEEDDPAGLLNMQGNSIAEWVARDEVRLFIQRKFRQFLETYSSNEEENRKEYREIVDNMVAGNPTTFSILGYVFMYYILLLSSPDPLFPNTFIHEISCIRFSSWFPWLR